jgi:hypothetical protein
VPSSFGIQILDNPFYFTYIISVSLAVGLFITPSATAPSKDLQVLIATND